MCFVLVARYLQKASASYINNWSPFGHPSSKSTSILPTLTMPKSLLLSFVFLLSSLPNPSFALSPTPTPWPLQFHAVLFMNYSKQLSLIDLWYDWPNGRNFNIIQDQLGGPPLYDLEWNNGTSFVYTLAPPLSCRSAQLDVGILRPNWLDGAEYLGREVVDGFLCNVWTKVEFIKYYEDVETKRPVSWIFYTGRTAHVMTFEVGAVLEDVKWQAPVYCFEKKESKISDLFHQNVMQKRSFKGFGRI